MSVQSTRREYAIAVGRHGINPRRGKLYRLEGLVTGHRRVVTRWNIVNVIDFELAHFAGLGLNAKATLEDDTLVMDLAPASLRDWPHIAGPSPAGFHGEPANGRFLMGNGFNPSVRKTADLLRTAKALCFRTCHLGLGD
jgi:hypothetical protein